MTFNLALPGFGRAALDPFPFPLLAAVVSTIALYLAAMILMTQRHDDEMATRREQITLELAILSEQKSSKIIALLEEFRRNDPNQGNQRDEVAEALAELADSQVVLEAIVAAEKAEDGSQTASCGPLIEAPGFHPYQERDEISAPDRVANATDTRG